MAALDTLVNTSLQLGDFDGTDRWCTALEDVADGVTSRAHVVTAVVARALAAHHPGHSDRATDLLDAFGWPQGLSPTEQGLAALHPSRQRIAARHDIAFDHDQRALELATAVDSRFLMSVAGSAPAELTGRVGRPTDALHRYREVLSAQRRDGHLTHAMFTLQTLVVTGGKLGLDHLAMVLLGALSDVRFASIRWAEADGLEQTRHAVSARQPPDQVQAWIDDGASTGSSRR